MSTKCVIEPDKYRGSSEENMRPVEGCSCDACNALRPVEPPAKKTLSVRDILVACSGQLKLLVRDKPDSMKAIVAETVDQITEALNAQPETEIVYNAGHRKLKVSCLCMGCQPTDSWVKCPVCGEPDMRRINAKDNGGDEDAYIIICTNHACLSNGGTYSLLDEQLERAKADRNKAGLEERKKYLPKIGELTMALQDHQDMVWKSMGTYSNLLGWGITGIQPECWTCLDMAVNELVAKRKLVADIRKLMGLPDRCTDQMIVDAVQLTKDLYTSAQSPRS